MLEVGRVVQTGLLVLVSWLLPSKVPAGTEGGGSGVSKQTNARLEMLTDGGEGLPVQRVDEGAGKVERTS